MSRGARQGKGFVVSCYKPLQGFRTPDGVVFSELGRYDILGPIELPCGHCIGCRMRRASDWELRVMHEATLQEANCFVTLTYGRDQCPPDFSLQHRDFQLFFKRLRKHFAPTKVRFFMCGEYGEKHQRPHYHACLFGVDFRSDRVQAGKSGSGMVFYDSPLLSKLWTHGIVSVQDLVPETASYCARYIMKKVLGPDSDFAYEYVDVDGTIVCRRKEYSAMSLRPGIGRRWFDKYYRDVYPLDSVVSRGVERRPPKYYDGLLKRRKPELLEQVDFERSKRRAAAFADNTDERRAVREVVHLAKVSNLKRGL